MLITIVSRMLVRILVTLLVKMLIARLVAILIALLVVMLFAKMVLVLGVMNTAFFSFPPSSPFCKEQVAVYFHYLCAMDSFLLLPIVTVNFSTNWLEY